MPRIVPTLRTSRALHRCACVVLLRKNISLGDAHVFVAGQVRQRPGVHVRRPAGQAGMAEGIEREGLALKRFSPVCLSSSDSARRPSSVLSLHAGGSMCPLWVGQGKPTRSRLPRHPAAACRGLVRHPLGDWNSAPGVVGLAGILNFDPASPTFSHRRRKHSSGRRPQSSRWLAASRRNGSRGWIGVRPAVSPGSLPGTAHRPRGSALRSRARDQVTGLFGRGEDTDPGAASPAIMRSRGSAFSTLPHSAGSVTHPP